MATPLKVALEVGLKGKKAAAVAQDWPGLERGGKTPEAALERLLEYIPRYREIARLAGMERDFAAHEGAEVVERYPGTGSTDFWGISFAFSAFDLRPVTAEELEREIALMRASWDFFDAVRGRVSAELRKGPRGGGKDRDQIVRHTQLVQLDWAGGLGIRTPYEELLTPAGLAAYREAYCAGIREKHARGERSGKWPLRYLIRHTAYHTLDHAWEMEDKDLTAQAA